MQSMIQAIERIQTHHVYGKVIRVRGLRFDVAGIQNAIPVGGRIVLNPESDVPLFGEVVGFEEDIAVCLPFGSLDGVRVGAQAYVYQEVPEFWPSVQWLGRVLDGMGNPVDGKGALPFGDASYGLRAAPPSAHARQRVGEKLDLGVRSLNTFITCCRGQRMGIFAGSGVGKSVLLSMLARNTACDVAVIGLIGERGREVQEFIQDDLGEAGLARSVVVVATSDEPALARRQAAYMTMMVAEYFRDQGANVLCLMDSVTRFAMAQREIGLSAGEPPTTKGYPPSVFGELPRLLERAGPGVDKGSITGLFTVLVEGGDMDEPVADSVRGILDGHIVMDRKIAERGRYPAVNILRSVSRTMPQCQSEEETAIVNQARQLMSAYDDMEELIRLGAYQRGADPLVDMAIQKQPMFEQFLDQRKDESTDYSTGFELLSNILSGDVEI